MPAYDLSTTRGRFTTYWRHIWHDHAYLRLANSNAHWLSDELVRVSVGVEAVEDLVEDLKETAPFGATLC